MQIRLSDDFPVGVNHRSIGQNDAQNFAVRPNHLPQSHKNAADNGSGAIHNVAARHFQPPQKTALQIHRIAVRQQTADGLAGFNVQNRRSGGNDAARYRFIVILNVSADQRFTDKIRSFEV